MALVELLARIEDERYREPVGRTVFQKMAYFSTERGIPTGLEFKKNSYGPYASELKRLTATLIHNGLIREERHGKRFEIRVGPAYEAARASYGPELETWDEILDTLTDLFVRMRRRQPEIAATVHFAAHRLVSDDATEADVLAAVSEWKARRDPPLPEADIAHAIRGLNLLGWIDADVTPTLIEDEFAEA